MNQRWTTVRNRLYKILFLLSFLLPTSGFCKGPDTESALKLVKDYCSFYASYEDMPNAEFRAPEIFSHPDAEYMSPGGDSETYEIVDTNYKVLKVDTKETNKNVKKDDVIITLRFKTYGYLDLFKGGFQKKIGFEEVAFYCSKSKGKYLIYDLSNVHFRFYESAEKFLKSYKGRFWESQLKGMRNAYKSR